MTKVTNNLASLAGVKLFCYRHASESTAYLWYPEGISEGLLTLRTFSSFWLYRTMWTEGCRPTQFHVFTSPISYLRTMSPNTTDTKSWGKWSSLHFPHLKYNWTGCLVWKIGTNVEVFLANLDWEWNSHYLNCHFLFFLISMILRRWVYNDFSTKFWYLYEREIHRFKDLWEKNPNH